MQGTLHNPRCSSHKHFNYRADMHMADSPQLPPACLVAHSCLWHAHAEHKRRKLKQALDSPSTKALHVHLCMFVCAYVCVCVHAGVCMYALSGTSCKHIIVCSTDIASTSQGTPLEHGLLGILSGGMVSQHMV